MQLLCRASAKMGVRNTLNCIDRMLHHRCVVGIKQHFNIEGITLQYHHSSTRSPVVTGPGEPHSSWCCETIWSQNHLSDLHIAQSSIPIAECTSCYCKTAGLSVNVHKHNACKWGLRTEDCLVLCVLGLVLCVRDKPPQRLRDRRIVQLR